MSNAGISISIISATVMHKTEIINTIKSVTTISLKLSKKVLKQIMPQTFMVKKRQKKMVENSLLIDLFSDIRLNI